MIAILLAGGRASRLGGGDKGLRRIGGRPIIERVVAIMRPQCDALLINANGDPARFAALDLPVVADGAPDLPGPLAGVLAGLDHVAEHHPQARFAVTVPTDAPFLPSDLVARLQDARAEDRAAITCAASAGRRHHAIALWSVELRHDLRQRLAEGLYTVSAFIERHPFAAAQWPALPYDPFFNVNTPDDLAEAEVIAARHG